MQEIKRSSTLVRKVGLCFFDGLKYLMLLYFKCMAFEIIVFLSINQKFFKKKNKTKNQKFLVNNTLIVHMEIESVINGEMIKFNEGFVLHASTVKR